MQFTKIIHLIGGEKILITQQESEALQRSLTERSSGFVKVQGNLVNKSSIAYIGDHHATAHLASINKAQSETEMKLIGQDEVVEARRLEEKRIAIESVQKGNRVMIGKEYADWMQHHFKELPHCCPKEDTSGTV